MEETIQFEDVRMIHVELEFYFRKDLIFHFSLFDLRLIQDFDGEEALGVLFFCQIDTAKAAISEFLAKFESVDVEGAFIFMSLNL